MCGIAGIFSHDRALERDLVAGMTRVLKHRGPDDEGYLAVETLKDVITAVPLSGSDTRIQNVAPLKTFNGQSNLYLGHRRLAILDLTTAGHQPMRWGDFLWIVYNGEIYNYLEIREQLKADGYEFKTGTDTEVILAAYDRWGEECVTRFNGDWAFCILDLRRNILFLSRDRYGIKPLYFFKDKQHFAFGSEIKALLTLPFLTRSLNEEKALHYILLFCLDHTEETFFSDVRQLKAGHNMTVGLCSGDVKITQYYKLPSCQEIGEYEDAQARNYADDVRDLLLDAVRLRLRADVPIGTCLSGGLDSSAVAGVTSKLLGAESHPSDQKTFTATFPKESIDESRFARIVIEKTGALGHLVYPTREDCWANLSKMLFYQDEPFGGAAIYSQWAVMREAARRVKVVLDGQGGDEVFAGYRDYRISFLANLWACGRVSEMVNELWQAAKLHRNPRRVLEELKLIPFFTAGTSLKRILYQLRYRRELKLASRDIELNGNNGTEHLDRKFTPDANALLCEYMMTYSLPHLLKYEDRNSMAHSIEARVPFTDHRLVDYVFSIPPVYKIHHGWTKWILRLALRDLLPPEIIWRKDKLGFATPPWISRHDVWNAWKEEVSQARGQA
jgi:asparagine synthase (glutamine-hydrolysing)